MAINQVKKRSYLLIFNELCNGLVKRGTDILVSLITLIILLPVFAIIAVLIKRDSPGPVIYRGKRVGKDGKYFTILKFRTMYESSESYAGPPVTACDDKRVTKIGRWLRDTKLNELPQFWNVLVGEMSLVGPRPEDPSIARTWARDVWREVLSVRPGITSPATILYHDEEKMLNSSNLFQKYMHELTPDKTRLDQLYVRYHSFWLDMDILLWTFLILLPKIGKVLPPEEKLFMGPITRFTRLNLSWFTIDYLVTLMAFYLTDMILMNFNLFYLGWINALAMVGMFIILFHVTGLLFGINNIRWEKAVYRDIIPVITCWVFACVGTYSLYYFYFNLDQKTILIPFLLSLGGFTITRYRHRLFSLFTNQLLKNSATARAARERVLIIGTGRTAEHIAWIFRHPTYTSKFNIVGFIDDNLMLNGGRIYGSTVVGSYKSVPEIIQKYDIGLVILADHTLKVKDYLAIVDACKKTTTKIILIPDMFGSFLNLTTRMNNGLPPLEVEDLPEDRCLHCLLRYPDYEDTLHPKPRTKRRNTP